MKYKSSKILYTSKGGHRGGVWLGLLDKHTKSLYIYWTRGGRLIFGSCDLYLCLVQKEAELAEGRRRATVIVTSGALTFILLASSLGFRVQQ